MSLMAEEMRRNGAEKLPGISADTKRRLRQIYTELSRALPDDTAGQRYTQLMDTTSTLPLSAGTKQVLQAIVRAAVANKSLPASADAEPGKQSRLEGDALTAQYVRAAAGVANSLPPDIGPSALLLALGIGLDDSSVLLGLPNTAGLVSTVETPLERSMRIKLIGEPTIHGRRDLAQHFFVSAHLAAVMGTAAAETAGLAKEFLDAQGSSGFSFADIAADRAGCRFASAVLDRELSLAMLSASFATAAFMPRINGLPEGLTAGELADQFGAKDDDRFRQQLETIDSQIHNLPPYRIAGPVLKK
jgi:hypothetical protein